MISKTYGCSSFSTHHLEGSVLRFEFFYFRPQLFDNLLELGHRLTVMLVNLSSLANSPAIFALQVNAFISITSFHPMCFQSAHGREDCAIVLATDCCATRLPVLLTQLVWKLLTAAIITIELGAVERLHNEAVEFTVESARTAAVWASIWLLVPFSKAGRAS